MAKLNFSIIVMNGEKRCLSTRTLYTTLLTALRDTQTFVKA
jgi:hypothetical protein